MKPIVAGLKVTNIRSFFEACVGRQYIYAYYIYTWYIYNIIYRLALSLYLI